MTTSMDTKRQNNNGAFYYCEYCKHRHSSDMSKLFAHVADLRSMGLRPTLNKQGRSNVLKVVH